MGKKGGSAPAPPDPRETSAAQTGTNVSTTLANNIMGMVNQNTPYGNLSYEQTGEYTWTDPYTGETYTVPTYDATTTLSPEQQALYDTNTGTQQNLADTALERSGFLQDYLSQGPIDPTDLSNHLYDLGRQRIDPRMEQMRSATHSRLANQGIAPGSEAYNREMGLVGQTENDAYTQLMLQGRGQALSELTAQRNQPLNEIIGLLSGTQVQNPNVQMSQPGAIPYTDNAGLINQNYNQRLAQWQQQQAQQQGLLGGLFSLGSSAIMASDRRVKRDIERIGEVEGLPVYSFRYIWDDEPRVGYMAQDVQAVKPGAVVDIGGVLHVDYAQLPEVVA